MVTVYVHANVLIHGDLTVLLLIQTYDWLEGLVHMRGVWRSTTMVPGALCVMITGICRMPRWYVINWAMAQLWVRLGLLPLEREEVPFGISMCSAVAMKPTLLSVAIVVLECTTAATVEMQE